VRWPLPGERMCVFPIRFGAQQCVLLGAVKMASPAFYSHGRESELKGGTIQQGLIPERLSSLHLEDGHARKVPPDHFIPRRDPAIRIRQLCNVMTSDVASTSAPPTT